MKRLIVAFVIIVLLMLIALPSYALKSKEFINYLTDKIYADCMGQEIKIKDGFGIANADTREPVTIIKPPYRKELIRSLVENLVDMEPYSSYIKFKGGYNTFGTLDRPNAIGIITSGSHKLDINYDEYYWDGTKVELPRAQINATQNISSGGSGTMFGNVKMEGNIFNTAKTGGSQSPAIVGNDTKPTIKNSIWNITLKVSIALAFSIGLALYFILRNRIARRRRVDEDDKGKTI